MAELLVSGYYGFQNAGDEAILGGIISAVRELDPSVQFTVISGSASTTRTLHGVEAVSRGDYQQIWQAMNRTNLLISGGGSLLQDVTGMRTIPYYLGIASMGKMRGVPVMFYAQGVGPVGTVVGKSLIPTVGNLVDQITVRDEKSAHTLRSLGIVRPTIEVTADAALVLGPADPLEGELLLRAGGVGLAHRPIIGVCIRAWKRSNGHMRRSLAAGLDKLVLKHGAQIVFIPMQQPNDLAAARLINALMTQPAVLMEGAYTYRQVQSLIGCCDTLVSMRYHGLVFSAMAGVPIVGLSYDPKNDSFLGLLGQRAIGTATHLEGDALTDAVTQALDNAQSIRQHYSDVIGELTPLSRRNARLALDLIR